ncbi:10514_t:CDS:2, partial [Entrophospora sp. SA101]
RKHSPGTPKSYVDIYTACWQANPIERPEMSQVIVLLDEVDINDPSRVIYDVPNSIDIITNMDNLLTAKVSKTDSKLPTFEITSGMERLHESFYKGTGHQYPDLTENLSAATCNVSDIVLDSDRFGCDAFHIIFVLDRSGSMRGTDRKPLENIHSNITFYGVSCVDGKDVLVFDWAELGTLKEVYEKNPEITWKQKLKIAHDICLGLQFIHECQLFHCDVRCENILIMGPDIATPKITNFFLSRKQMDMSKKIPSLNDIMPWMAPEKLDLKGRYTTKCEIYSFGMLLWELAFQQVPYLKRFNSNYEEISLHVKSGQREYLNFDNKDEIQRCFNYIISKAWHKKLESRPNMPDILKILEKLYKKHYFTRSKSYCENTTYGSLDDDDFDFNVTNEFIKSDTCELDFKEIGTSTVEDAIKLHKERADESRKQAWKYFEYHSDTLNNFTAKYWKGYYLLEGLGGVKKDPKMAMELFKEAADNDVASAQFHYAFLISQNADNDLSLVEECITYLEKAADNGNLPALFNLGNIYYNGKWNIQQDIERGVKYYKMSA